MWTETAYGLFVCLAIVLYHRLVKCTLQYGRQLRELRNTCCDVVKTLRQGDPVKANSFIILVRKIDDGSVVYTNKCGSNERELIRFLADKSFPEHVLKVLNMPDANSLSHTIMVYKASDDVHECLACMQL